MATETGNITHNVSKRRYLASLKIFGTFQQKKSREYTTIILTFLALIIFGVFAIKPTLYTIVELRKQLEDSKQLDAQLDEKINNLSSLQGQYSTLTPDLPLVTSALPALPNTPLFLGQIQSLISSNSLTVNQISSENIPYAREGLKEGELGSFVVSYTLSGVYPNIKKFIEEAVFFDRVVTVDDLTIVRDEDTPTTLNATAKLKVYFDQKPL